MTALTIDVVSDVMCPWCYIGKKRLEIALSMRQSIPVDVRWRAYKLDPTIPDGGVDRVEYLEKKFGEKADAIYSQIEQTGRDVGIDFRFSDISRSPNTTNAHRLIRWSYGQNAQDDVVEGLFRSFFTEGGDVEDIDTLAAIAEHAGMDGKLVREVLETKADKDAIDAEIRQAQQIGVQGVPCFIFGARLAVMGAQAPEILADAMDKTLEAMETAHTE